MGNQLEKPVAPTVPHESHNSARNVLEKIGKHIKDEINKKKNNTNKLKGTLSKAQFLDGLYRATGGKVRTGPGGSCELSHLFHTNITNQHERNPCHGRKENRFDENAEAYCNSDKIRDNGERSAGGACVPFRRQNLCDKNLEFLDNNNTNTTDDLLGNVLVTAKYEGESIVKNHPNKETSDVCTALARSFADIGDIVRGRDMFKSNDKVENGLKKVFDKIHKKLGTEGKEYYNDTNNKINYVKLREAWWKANRDQVWRAITCNAPYKSRYFIQSENNTQLFSNRQCGHGEHEVLTNLDYVPQFLRWFEEWAEEFCRKKNIKLENVKKACRDEEKGIYCSHNGYDCTQTIRNKDICIRESKCTGCLVKCSLYDDWLRNQRNEFEKQKEKYDKEILKYKSNEKISGSNINNKYYEEFYKNLKEGKYETANEFINLLNEGRYCKKKKNSEEENIDFTMTGDKDAFYRSDYCQVCPYCGVDCDGTNCKPRRERYPDCGNNEAYDPPNGAETTEINVINSGDKQVGITEKLSEFCNDKNNKNGKNYQKWECYYKHIDDNKCKMEINIANSKLNNKITSFDEFFDLWVRKFLIDTIKWENELKDCINNRTTDCSDGCNKHCVCFDKWVKQKEQEWKSIMELFKNEHVIPEQYKININKLFNGYFFQVMDKVNKDVTKWNQLKQELKKKIDSSKGNEGTKDSESAIELLLDHLKESATTCKDNNANEACDSSKKVTQYPCVKNNNGGKVVSVKQIAQYYKRKAYIQLNERAGRSKLKGDASQGQYERTGNASDFKDICKITKDHSNAHSSRSPNPCNGKNQGRFNIGTEWSYKDNKNKPTHPEAYMPPRREHMCTSNLEHLNTGNKGLSDGTLASHSLLGDVLLAVKKEGEFIADKLRSDSDKSSICNAMKYSFADLGDIIRGRDLWERNGDMVKLETNLKKIFKNIKDKLPGDIQKKYTDNTKHLELRKDWWEANRAKVWEAMQCSLKDVNTSEGDCIYKSRDRVPVEDYIPQRLRWMTEWAEWFCKMQSQEYDKLVGKCNGCMNKGKCKQGNGHCVTCKTSCENYKKFINTWQPQWKQMEQKYSQLYEEAKKYSDSGKKDTKNKNDYVLKFLNKLQKENGVVSSTPSTKSGNTATSDVYGTAAGYVHQEATMNCHTQNQFCEKKHGVKPSNGREDNEYAFRPQPHDHEKECNCQSRNREPPRRRRGVLRRGFRRVPRRRRLPQNVVVGGAGRSEDHNENTTPRPAPPDQKDGANEDSEEEEEEEDDDAGGGSDVEAEAEAPQEPGPKEEVKVCDIVEVIFNGKSATSAIYGCNTKNYNDWNCKPSDVHSDHAGACMPPRREKLCIYYFGNQGQIRNMITQEKLKDGFIKSAAGETFLSWQKYKTDNKSDVNLQNKLESGIIPEDFKRKMFYTFGDLRDFLFGTDISKNHGKGSELEKQIYSLFPPNGEKAGKLTREEWWNGNGPKIWNAMLCALSYNTNEKTFKDKVHSQLTTTYPYSLVKFSGDKTTTLEEFAQRPQFLRWLTEWYDDYCHTRQKYLKDVKEKCKSNDQLKCDKECNKKCEDYEKYMKKKKEEWIPQDKYYKDERDKKEVVNDSKGIIVKDYVLANAKEYLKKTFTASCITSSGNTQNSATNAVETNIELLEKQSYYDADQYCGCTKFIKDTEYTMISGENNCKGLKNEATKGTIKWIHSDDKDHTYLKKNGLPSEVYVPPRRQRICFEGLDNTKIVTNKSTLRMRLMKLAATEGYNLGQYYKNKEEQKNNADNYSYEVGPCSAMKYSFYDLRDIILGYDNLEDNTQTEKNMKKIFKDSNTRDGSEPGSIVRQTFWNNNKDCVWEAMKCGYKKSGETIPDECKNMPRDSDYPIASNRDEGTAYQFLRWFAEWGEDFCKHKEKELEKLVGACNDYNCGDNENKKKKCTSACTQYKQFISEWKPQYEKQIKKYGEHKDKIYSRHPMVKEAKDAQEYLDKQLQKSCNSGGKCDCMNKKSTSNGNNMPASLDDAPNEYKQACSCQLPQPPSEPARPASHEPAETLTSACNIVDEILRNETENKFKDLCAQKFKNGKRSYPGWDCNSSIFKTGEQEGACMPPRRQKLYIHKLKELSDQKSETDLRQAFIECTAVETFFSWHEYKQEKKREKKKETTYVGGIALLDEDEEETSPEEDPQTQLNKGIIPEDFKRQMFYTYADYRDIFFGNDIGNYGIKDIYTNVQKILEKQNGLLVEQKDDKRKRENWWNVYGKDIWEGMLCALSYNIETKTKNEDVQEKLTKNDKKTYNYENVTINSVPSDNTTSLSKFASRPQFFRWLEEWGETFCGTRKRMLKNVNDNCRPGIYGDKTCSGDGFDCDEMPPKKEEIFKPFYCYSCAEECRKYRKWIERKKTEYEEQEKAYKNQKAKYTNKIKGAESNFDIFDPHFVQKLDSDYASIESFLGNLKIGPCKINHEDEKDNGEDEIKFGDKKKTFKHAENCKPCSEFKVKCNGNGSCSGGGTKVTCNPRNGTINAKDIGNVGNSTKNLHILVNDNNTNRNKFDDLQVCEHAGIFQGIRKDVWKCGEFCGVDICTLEKKDYNKIKKKLKACIKNEKNKLCINGCYKNCNCVEKWIKEKEKEWKQIKEHYLQQYNSKDNDYFYNLKAFLEQGIFGSDKKKAIEPCKDLGEFERSTHCNGAASSENGKPQKKDIIECLLDKLEKKTKKCKDDHPQPSAENQAQTCENSTPPEDEDNEQTLEDNEENEKTNIQPGFCPPPIQQQDEGEEKCEEAKPPGTVNDVKEEEEEKEEEKDKGDEEIGSPPAVPAEPEPEPEPNQVEEEKGPPAPAAPPSTPAAPKKDKKEKQPLPKPKPQPEPPQPYLPPALKNAMLSSTIMWSVGISFAAISYFLLKKKPKSPVDLIRVLDIHKGDYDISTLKSSNRYIPYVSDRHKGKTYIYMEGDSDSGHYYEDTTDITSSSESEYEEMDINDIYPYTSPKYKTLIEVVLEPSKSNGNTPSKGDGNTLGDDMVPTTNTFTDEQWSELKHDFISQYIQSESLDVPQYDVSTELPMNIVDNVLDDGINEKPFITSIHDRDLYTGEEISYNIDMSTNSMDDPKYVSNNVYSGIDLINDSLSGGEPIDIYNEVLKRKENELFGTNYKKNTSNNSVAKNTNSDPIMNQLDLLHKWLDRHRDMCEKWNNKEDILNKLNEQWNKDNNSGDIPNDNKTLNTDVSIQIDMDETKGKKEFSNMDTILDDIEDDIYYDVNDDENPSVDDIPMDHNKVDVPKKVHVEMKILNNTSNGTLEPEFPISDVWNI
ncbi:erythrocyte membrane protein 1 [Plasmodium falciparum IGH-CR14]|uniref:Erythrocyte membrane protein 1 n=1 Tax=Plasmodium falciparum IGH-CR14 TaxID=580059 RepID=A0A0L1I8F6_PLAFA|nr:erythrocyte membrane protein 1 [Plasmodium falciparum IGH-CR14]